MSIIAHKRQKGWHGPILSTKFKAEVTRFNNEIASCLSVEELDECRDNNSDLWRQMLLDTPDDCKEYNFIACGDTTGMHIKKMYYTLNQNEEFKGEY